jgi:hypothetical protein
MSKDLEINTYLERIVRDSCIETGSNPDDYKVKVMGKIRRYKSMKSGYYIQIQNFKSLTSVKKSLDNKYFRYYFRCIQFQESEKRKIPLLEICKWTPSMGSVEDGKVVYRDDDMRYKGTFLERMITVMNMVKLKL